MRNASSILLLANGAKKGFVSGGATMGAGLASSTPTSAIRVLMIKRHTKARFMANMYVFPGGVLEESDGLVSAGPDAKQSLDPFRVAALRELWEETSVAITADGAAVGRAPAALLDPATVGGLTPFAHWITPVSEKYRYDTWFFGHKATNDEEALRLDMAQCPREVADVRWVSPHEALEMHQLYAETDFCVSPPTWCLLDWLRRFEYSEGFLDHCRAKYRIAPYMHHVNNAQSSSTSSSPPLSPSHQSPSVQCSTDAELISGVIPSVLTSYREYADGTSSNFIPSGTTHLPDGEYPHLIYGDCMVYVGDAYKEKYLAETTSGLLASKEGMRTRK